MDLECSCKAHVLELSLQLLVLVRGGKNLEGGGHMALKDTVTLAYLFPSSQL